MEELGKIIDDIAKRIDNHLLEQQINTVLTGIVLLVALIIIAIALSNASAIREVYKKIEANKEELNKKEEQLEEQKKENQALKKIIEQNKEMIELIVMSKKNKEE